jgi:hypothetical protein
MTCVAICACAGGAAAAASRFRSSTHATGVLDQLEIAVTEVLIVIAVFAALIGLLVGLPWVLLERNGGATAHAADVDDPSAW